MPGDVGADHEDHAGQCRPDHERRVVRSKHEPRRVRRDQPHETDRAAQRHGTRRQRAGQQEHPHPQRPQCQADAAGLVVAERGGVHCAAHDRGDYDAAQ